MCPIGKLIKIWKRRKVCIQMSGEAEKTNNEVVEQERAGHLREKRRQKNRNTAFVGFMLLFLVLLAGSVGIYAWIDAKLQDDAVDTMQTQNETPADGAEEASQPAVSTQVQEITYTQAELEEQIARAKQEGADEVLASLAESINNNGNVVNALRPLYENALVVASNGQYHFIPIDETRKMHSLQEENLKILDNGLVEYVENGQVVSHKGIDVSKHQGEIDWAKVAEDGVEFAFIRVGNRGYGTGAIVEDPQFDANVVGAITNGIDVGVYFFSQAVTVEEAIEEAQFVLNKIAPYNLSCPIVLDVEKVSDSEARMNKISVEERTANTLAFLQTIEAAGYETMLYHNMEMGTLMLDMTQFEDYEKWFAYYNKEIYYPYEFTVWQYSDKGRVQGIKGDVDVNISFRMWDE